MSFVLYISIIIIVNYNCQMDKVNVNRLMIIVCKKDRMIADRITYCVLLLLSACLSVKFVVR